MNRPIVVLILGALSGVTFYAFKKNGGHTNARAPQTASLSGAPKSDPPANQTVPSSSHTDFADKIEIALKDKRGRELNQAVLSIVHNDLKSFTFFEALEILGHISNNTIYWQSVKALISSKSMTADNCRQILDWTLAQGDLPNDVRRLAAAVCAYHMSREDLEKLDLTTSKSFVAGFFHGLRKRPVDEMEYFLDKVKDSPFLADAYQSLISSCFNCEYSSPSADQLYRWTQKMPPGQARNDLQSMALYRIAQSNPDDAAARALELFAINAPGAELAVSGVVRGWMEYDGLAASTWVNSLPPGDARDAAAVQLVRSLAHNDPSAALRWAKSIVSEKHKQASMDLLRPHIDVSIP